MAITCLAGFSSAIKSVGLNASISWAARASIKILCDGRVWELGLTSMFLVVGKLPPEADFHCIKGYRLHIAMQSCTKLTLKQNSSNPGYCSTQ